MSMEITYGGFMEGYFSKCWDEMGERHKCPTRLEANE
jgi:hypothetical protein